MCCKHVVVFLGGDLTDVCQLTGVNMCAKEALLMEMSICTFIYFCYMVNNVLHLALTFTPDCFYSEVFSFITLCTLLLLYLEVPVDLNIFS